MDNPDTNDRAPAPLRLLLVDDDAAIREVSVAILAKRGYEVLAAEDGVQALEMLTQSCPDLVITDLRMPRMSGFELLEIMRERFPRLPVIAVSGEYFGDEPPLGLKADAFLPKCSCYLTPLMDKITELLSRMELSQDPVSGGGPDPRDAL